MKPELIHYYKKGKIDFGNLVNALGDNSYEEVRILKSDSEKNEYD